MRTLRAAWLVFLKDLRIELRTGEIVITTSLFAALVAVLASVSLYIDNRTAPRVAPGVLWIAIAFAGILAMGRSWNREREFGVMRALMLSPIPRAAIYLGKALGTLLFLAVVEVILMVLVGILFHVDLFPILGALVALLLLGTVGFTAAGNLFAAMGVHTQTRNMVLAVAVFPIIAPALLCGVVATRELLQGAPPADILGWINILIAFDIVFVTFGLLLFEPLMSD